MKHKLLIIWGILIIIIFLIFFFCFNTLICCKKDIIINYLFENCNGCRDSTMARCAACEELRRQDTARILIYSKQSLCDSLLLNPPVPSLALSNSIDTFPNRCSPDSCKFILVGYYMQSELILSSVNNRIKFTPLWLYHCNEKTIQFNGKEIIIGPDYRSKLNSELPNATNVDFLSAVSIIAGPANGIFNHSSLQFHPEIDTLDKTYISYYELKMILENCTHLGISGAMVSTGNIATTLNTLQGYNAGNKEYFTYRLIGLKEANLDTTNCPGCKRYYRADLIFKREIGPADGTIGLSSDPEFDISIPTETWATPCPPMWYRQ